MTQVMSGYPELDSFVSLEPSQLVVIAGHTSIGKSALALNICINAAKNGSRVVIFNLEMRAETINLRTLSSEAEVDSYRLRLDLTTLAEQQRIIDVIGYLSDLPLNIDDTPGQTATQIISKARRLALEHGIDLIVVDYLQLVEGNSGPGTSRTQEISEIFQSLKFLAQEFEVPIIVCSQLNSRGEGPYSRQPQLLDLPDSIALEADTVMFIHREDLYITEVEWEILHPGYLYPQNIAYIIIAKNNNGPTGTVQLLFRDFLTRFDSYNWASG